MKYIKTSVIMVSVCWMCQVSHGLALSGSDLQTIGRRYGVSPHLLRAISMVESQSGELLGEYEVRQVVDHTQLKFLKKIARYTGRSISDFKGSDRGAMGYMQIIPSTFYMYAQDGDGDGVKDPLNAHDSVATAAYYLARELAKKNSTKAALKSYNNDTDYCEKILTLYREFTSRNSLTDNVTIATRNEW
jgi:membrane-bound lytic murein transglycosylase B